MSGKVYAAFCENFNGIRGVCILAVQRVEELLASIPLKGNGEQDALRVKVEVKLPGTPFRRYLPISIGQGNSKLDELQDINVATHRLVMIIC